MEAQEMVEHVMNMPARESAEFWRLCMSYAQQFPEVEFWSVVAAVFLAPRAMKQAL